MQKANNTHDNCCKLALSFSPSLVSHLHQLFLGEKAKSAILVDWLIGKWNMLLNMWFLISIRSRVFGLRLNFLF